MARAEEMMQNVRGAKIDFERARLSLLRTLQQLQAECGVETAHGVAPRD